METVGELGWIRLNFIGGTSDKEYRISLERRETTRGFYYAVVGRWGRRGSKLQQEKVYRECYSPGVLQSKARDLLNEKLLKGYTVTGYGGSASHVLGGAEVTSLDNYLASHGKIPYPSIQKPAPEPVKSKPSARLQVVPGPATAAYRPPKPALPDPPKGRRLRL